jgi:hypothetical protein
MADMLGDATKASAIIVRVVGLILLVFFLLYVLTWTNTLKCKYIPAWCDIYYGIRGKPRVLIAYGDYGLGDPELLSEVMSDPNHIGVRPAMLHIDYINPGNLKEFDIVIVEKARKMSSEKLKMFIDYANTGGRLIWTGDAAAEVTSEKEYLYRDELSIDSNVPHEIINPWARKLNDEVVLLNELLSLEYVCNYSDIRGKAKTEHLVGNLIPINRENPFVYGLSASLPLYISPETDFAIVKPLAKGTSTTVLTLDFGSKLYAQGKEYSKTVPFIVTNAKGNIIGLKIGENVAYYAMPPEYFAHPSLSVEHRYMQFIEKMYFGMLYG